MLPTLTNIHLLALYAVSFFLFIFQMVKKSMEEKKIKEDIFLFLAINSFFLISQLTFLSQLFPWEVKLLQDILLIFSVGIFPLIFIRINWKHKLMASFLLTLLLISLCLSNSLENLSCQAMLSVPFSLCMLGWGFLHFLGAANYKKNIYLGIFIWIWGLVPILLPFSNHSPLLFYISLAACLIFSLGASLTKWLQSLSNEQMAFRKNTLHLKNLYELSPIAQTCCDTQGNICFSNFRFRQLTGFSQVELQSMKLLDFSPEYKQIIWQNALDTLKTRGDFAIETQFLRKDKELIVISITAVRIDINLFLISFYDINEDRKQLQKLSQEKKQKDKILDSMEMAYSHHELIYSLEKKPLDYRFLEINTSYQELTGIPRLQLIGRTSKEAMPNAPLQWLEKFHQVVSTQKAIRFQSKIESTDRYCDIYAFPTGPKTFACIFSDITKSYKTIQLQQKLNALLLSFSYDHQKNIHLALEQLASIFGAKSVIYGQQNDLQLLEVLDTISPPKGFKVTHYRCPFSVDTLASKGRYYFIEDIGKTHKYKDPNFPFTHFMSYLGIPLNSEHDDLPPAIVSLFFDHKLIMHEQDMELLPHFAKAIYLQRSLQNAEEKQKEKEMARRHLFQSSQEGLIFVNARTLVIKEANPAICQMLEIPLNQMEDSPLKNLFSQDQYQQFVSKINGASFPFELKMELQNKSQQTLYCQVTVSSYLGRGENHFWINFRNITAEVISQKEKEEQQNELFLNYKLASIGELASSIAHEINNPLSILSASNEIQQRAISQHKPLTQEKQMRFLQSQEKAITRMSEIISGLRGFTRTNQEEREVFDANALVVDTLNFISTLLMKESIQIENNACAEKLPIWGNTGHFQQILINLITNAKDAIAQQPDRIIKISTIKQNSKVIVKIEDNGPGLTPEIKDKIFENFFSTKKRGKGTGLGMGIVKKLCQRLDGEVFAGNSEETGGAQFIISLPYYQEYKIRKKSSLEQSLETFPLLKDKKILLVDDEEDIRDFLKDFLESNGIIITTADNGVHALQLLQEGKQQFDAIISDFKMPKLDGLEFFNALKGQFKSPFFLMTGDPEEHPNEVTQILAKPFKLDEILKALHKHLS